MAAGANVHLIDDRAIFRDALRGLLEREGVRIVGESSSPAAAPGEVAASAPEIIVTEVRFRDGSGIGLLQDLAESWPGVRLIAHSNSRETGDIVEALRAGAHAYVLKEHDIGQLVRAIAAVRQGGGYLSAEVARIVIDVLRRGELPIAEAAQRVSDRELEVIQLIALGMDNRQIGEQLGISERTVKNHVAHILRKLDLDNRVQAAVFAVRSGLA